MRRTLLPKTIGQATRQSKAYNLAVILRRLGASESKNSALELRWRDHSGFIYGVIFTVFPSA